MSNDFELLDAWAAGDKGAARELFDRYFPALYRFFRNKVSAGIEDLVQDTMLSCVAGRDRFRRDASFRTWLYATARNILLMDLRKRRKDEQIDPQIDSVCDVDPSPSSVVAKREEQRLLLEALRRIPVDDQVLLELYYWEKLSGPELAQTLSITEAALRSRLYRAKQLVKKRMEELAKAPDLAASTWAGLDAWAASCRDALPGQSGDQT